MNAPLLPMLGADEALRAAEGARVPAEVVRLNVFRLLMRSDGVARGLWRLVASLLAGTSLDPRLRELSIMRVAWRTASVYEWTQHWHIAIGVGVSEGELLGTRQWQEHAGYGPTERAVLQATDECVEAGCVAPPTLAELRRHLPDAAVIELVTAIGAWSMMSTLLRSFDVPLEEGLDAWPPDGRRPAPRDDQRRA